MVKCFSLLTLSKQILTGKTLFRYVSKDAMMVFYFTLVFDFIFYNFVQYYRLTGLLHMGSLSVTGYLLKRTQFHEKNLTSILRGSG